MFKRKMALAKIKTLVGTIILAYHIVGLPLMYLGVFNSDYASRFDALMPWWPTPYYLIGAILLLGVASQARRYQTLLILSVGPMALAQVVGDIALAVPQIMSGVYEAPAWPGLIVLARFSIIWIGLVGASAVGALLLQYLIRAGRRVDGASQDRSRLVE